MSEQALKVVDQLTEAIATLGWLAERGALGGVAEIISERRKLAEQRAEPGEYAAESALNFGEQAKAGALIALQLDEEGQAR